MKFNPRIKKSPYISSLPCWRLSPGERSQARGAIAPRFVIERSSAPELVTLKPTAQKFGRARRRDSQRSRRIGPALCHTLALSVRVPGHRDACAHIRAGDPARAGPRSGRELARGAEPGVARRIRLDLAFFARTRSPSPRQRTRRSRRAHRGPLREPRRRGVVDRGSRLLALPGPQDPQPAGVDRPRARRSPEPHCNRWQRALWSPSR